MIRNTLKKKKIINLRYQYGKNECDRIIFLICKKNNFYFKEYLFFNYILLKKKEIFLSRIRNYCSITNHTRWILNFFKLSRMTLKIELSKGLLYGFRNKVW